MLRDMLRFSLANDLRKRVVLHRLQRKWRKNNMHNDTCIRSIFDLDLLQVGKATYGNLHITSYAHDSKIYIGNYCSIAEEVRFVINGGHRIDTISSFPFKVNVLGEKEEATTKGDIIVDDDVWIGYRATILDGVHIGQGAVVAAGAVVSSDVDPYTIVGGVPARPIKRRFADEEIELLMQVDYAALEKAFVQDNIADLYRIADRDLIIQMTKVMPKKPDKSY